IVSGIPANDLSTFSWMSDHSIIFAVLRRIWFLDLDSGKRLPITADTMEEILPAAASDGRIIFTSIQRQYDVIQIPLEGDPPQDLIVTDLTEGAPYWAPDGKSLVYSSRRNDSDVILMENMQDRSDKVLVGPEDFKQERIYVSRVAFSPDGQRIAYKVWADN